MGRALSGGAAGRRARSSSCSPSSGSLRPRSRDLKDADSPVPKFFNFTPTLDNYRHIFVQRAANCDRRRRRRLDTDSPTFSSTASSSTSRPRCWRCILGTLAAYGFSRFRVPAKNDLLFFILSTRMLPPVAVLIPIFLMYTDLGLVDTYQGMILLYTTFNIPFAVWMMKGFIDEIPKEYEDAAMVDGYTRFQAFYKVIVPQSLPAAAATAVFLLITVWNEFVFATQLTQVNTRTAPPGIAAAQTHGWDRLGPDCARLHAVRLARGDLYVPGAQLPAARRHLRRRAPVTRTTSVLGTRRMQTWRR